MAYLKDRAAIAVWTIRRLSPDIDDKQAEAIEAFLRDELFEVDEERATGFVRLGRIAERLVEKLSKQVLDD